MLSSGLVDFERQCWANAQHLRREWLCIVGIFSKDKDKALKESVVGIFNKLGCSINADCIKTCHRKITVTKSQMQNLLDIKSARRSGIKKESQGTLKWSTLIFFRKEIYLQTVVYIHIIKYYGLKVGSYFFLEKYTVFTFRIPPLKSKSMRIVLCCLELLLMTSKNIFLILVSLYLDHVHVK